MRLLTLLILFLLGLPPAIGHAVEQVSLQLPWHHQFQFAGYYMAKEKGFYRNADLEVEIRDISHSKDTVADVVSGEADFGVDGCGLLVERSQGRPVVAVAAIFQQSPMIFLALQKSGINAPDDLKGKRVMLSSGQKSLKLTALLYQKKLLDKIIPLNTSYDVHSLINGETDVFNAYRTNEPYLLKSLGYPYRIIDPADYGIGFYGDILFTSDNLAQKQPDLVERFRQASINGWYYALAHPDETIELIKKNYRCPKSLDHLHFEAEETAKVIRSDLVEIGFMGATRWKQITHYLIAIGTIAPEFDLDPDFIFTPPPGIAWGKVIPWFILSGAIGVILLSLIGMLLKANYNVRKTRDELAQREEKYSTVVNSQQDALLLHKLLPDGFAPFTEVNTAAIDLYGYTREELLKLSSQDIVDPQILKNYDTSTRKKNLLSNRELITESVHIKKGGEPFPVEIRASIVELAGENYILTVVRDITNKKLTEEKYRILVNEARAGMALADAETGELLDCNRTLADMVERSREELIGQKQSILHPPEYLRADGITTDFSTSRNTKAGENIFTRCLTASGRLIEVEIRSKPIEYAGRKMMLGIFYDISELLSLQKQLRQKYKMEAVGVMAGGIAHNFNNSLSVILGSLELARMKVKQPDKVLEFLNTAAKASIHARDLVKQILSYSRRDLGKKSSTDLALVTEETMKLLRSTLPTTVKVDVQYDPKIPMMILADAGQIQETLINLCNNAVQAMNEEGLLKIQLLQVEIKEAEIPAQYDCSPGAYILLQVADNGCGMDKETLERIFDPFFTTKGVGEGTGMGLSTVQGIVDQHGGFIKVESSPGRGASFFVYFPRLQDSENKSKTSKVTSPLLPGSERILFVDDDEILIELGKEMLAELGYRVTTAATGRLALEQFTAEPSNYDLVITDQTMPELTGKELIRELKKIRSDLPTILTTGYSSKISEEEAAAMGIDAFCLKPLDLPELAQTIRRVLDRH